jgi:hypothetical protein
MPGYPNEEHDSNARLADDLMSSVLPEDDEEVEEEEAPEAQKEPAADDNS